MMMRMIWRGLLVVAAIVLLMQFWYLAHVLWWKSFDPDSTAFMEDGLERLQEKNPDAELRYRWVDYNRVSIQLKRAVIAAEDSRFLAHEGFDWEGMEVALEKNLKKGRIVAGGSTISQQLSKNLFLSASRNPLRKVQEAVITVMIESLWSKRRILEVYLNVIEWGNGVFGAEAAARVQVHQVELSNNPQVTILTTPAQVGSHPDPAGALAAEAQAWLAEHGASGIVVTGGDTLGALLRALQAHGVDLEQEAAPGIPLGRIAGGPWAGLRIISKAGGFGEPSVLVDAVQLLTRKDANNGR